jgi:peptide/nickel transport system permease protein
MMRLTLSAALGAALIALLVLTVLLSLVWTPLDPLAIDLPNALSGPSAAHWLGADEFGRDVLSRAMAGARISVGIALVTVALSVSAGTVLGVAAGFLRGPVDRGLMTLNDALLAFPGMLLALGVIAVYGAGAGSIIAALAIAYLPSVVRVVRGTVLSIREREYVEASRVMGNSELWSMVRHVAPNASPQIAILATSLFGWVLLSESALSFLGVGVPAPAPTWGNMLASARPYLDTAVWLGITPGLCIAATLLGANLLSDALRDRFDPRSERR